MLTNEFCIAVHALVFLHHKATLLSSEELAKNICTNPVCIRKVLAKLKQAGLVTTKEGLEGGYACTPTAATVTLQMIAQALQFRFITTNWHSGKAEAQCPISAGMATIMDNIYQQLNETCQQQLAKLTIQDITQQLLPE